MKKQVIRLFSRADSGRASTDTGTDTHEPAVDIDADIDSGRQRVSWRLRTTAALLLLPTVAYCLVCLVYNAPASPASVRLAGPVDAMTNTYFTQDWELFAPTPATDNSLLFLQVQLRSPGSETTQTTAAQDIEAAIDVLPRSGAGDDGVGCEDGSDICENTSTPNADAQFNAPS